MAARGRSRASSAEHLRAFRARPCAFRRGSRSPGTSRRAGRDPGGSREGGRKSAADLGLRIRRQRGEPPAWTSRRSGKDAAPTEGRFQRRVESRADAPAVAVSTIRREGEGARRRTGAGGQGTDDGTNLSVTVEIPPAPPLRASRRLVAKTGISSRRRRRATAGGTFVEHEKALFWGRVHLDLDRVLPVARPDGAVRREASRDREAFDTLSS